MQYGKKDLEALLQLREIIEAYEEIASIRMQKIKVSVLQNREFLAGLKRLSVIVNHSYRHELARLKKQKRSSKLRSHNDKTIAVLLTSNTGLYGEIITKTFRLFSEYVTENPHSDIAIVGRRGNQMFQSSHLETNGTIENFELADSFSDVENIKRLLSYLLEYKDVYVFRGQFNDMLRQEPVADHITEGEDSDAEDESIDISKPINYVFEPSLEDVVAYFESEIIASLFEQAVHEASLSKYASRMISLDRATEKIKDEIHSSKLRYQRLKHRVQNKKQITTLASIYKRL